jgi:hypothetical protein
MYSPKRAIEQAIEQYFGDFLSAYNREQLKVKNRLACMCVWVDSHAYCRLGCGREMCTYKTL